MAETSTTTQVERIRIRSIGIGRTSLRRLQDDLQDIDGFLLVSALLARSPHRAGAVRVIAPLGSAQFSQARADVGAISIIDFSMNSPWQMLLEFVQTPGGASVAGGSTLASAYALWTKFKKAGPAAIDMVDKYYDLTVKRSDSKLHSLRNRLEEQKLREELGFEKKQAKRRGQIINKYASHSNTLTAQQEKELEDAIRATGRIRSIVKSIEVEQRP